jgi:hypothetical protein
MLCVYRLFMHQVRKPDNLTEAQTVDRLIDLSLDWLIKDSVSC